MTAFRISCAACLSLFAWAALPLPAQAQGLLERLEKRLEGVLAPTERAEPEPAATATEPGYLGLVGDDEAEEGRGVRVLTVREASAAEAAGLREADLIVAVNDAAITSLDDLDRQLAGATVGARVNFTIEREGKQQAIAVTLGRRPVASTPERPAPERPAPERPAPERPAPERSVDLLPPPRVPTVARPEDETVPEEESPLFPATRASLGITVVPVTEEARRRYGFSVRQGALISAITPGGAADRAGLPMGAVVVAAEGRRIDRPDDLIELVRGMRPGEDLMLSYYRGGTLLRKTVRVGESPRGEASPVVAEEPRRETVREGDRPLLKRLERALDAVAPERGVPPERTAPAPRLSAREPSDELRAEVDRLRARVDDLERRLARLEEPGDRGREPGDREAEAATVPEAEARPAAAEGVAEDSVEPDPAAEPPLRLNPPKEPPPPPRPGVK